MRKLIGIIGIPLLSLLTTCAFGKMKTIVYRGWKDCYEISNSQVRVIINTSAGGRIMRYERNGINVIYENRKQDGKMLDDYMKEKFDPDGGRFDIGQEKATRSIHEGTYMGRWHGEIIDEYALKITSMPDQRLGLVLTRTFSLDPESSHLDIQMSMENISDTKKEYFFWGRTLVEPGGKLLMPLNPDSQMDHGWGRYIWGDPVRFECDPDDPGVEIKRHIFSLLPTSAGNEKYGADAREGWMAYGYKGLLFIKRYDQSGDATFCEEYNQTNILYTNKRFAEMEPISPCSSLAPGENTTFTEHWYLEEYPDTENNDFDVLKTAAYIRSFTSPD